MEFKITKNNLEIIKDFLNHQKNGELNAVLDLMHNGILIVSTVPGVVHILVKKLLLNISKTSKKMLASSARHL